MSAISQLRYSPLSSPNPFLRYRHHHCHLSNPISYPFSPPSLSLRLSSSGVPLPPHGGGGNHSGGGGSHGGGGGHSEDSEPDSWWTKLGLLGVFVKGWRERVAADPQFPFKVLMEEVVGVTSCVLGDMASRPNFGLNELDFVFSTLIVGSILNFTLMYLLAPTLSATSSVSAFPSHFFEPGSFGLGARFGALVYKGAVFAAVGFAAGLVGTAVSNGLIAVRKKMDPEFETPNKPPPTLLNAVTWALHMGLSSNLRYQTLNGVEYVMEKAVPSAVFKTAVVGLRCANNVLGGVSFVVLARLTGSQSVGGGKEGDGEVVVGSIEKEKEEKEKEKLVVAEVEGLGSNQST